MKTIGLTGGIACGKSTVAAMLRDSGVPVIDADQVARDVVAPGQPALAEIAETFGEHLILDDGTLDRKGLGALVFGTAPEQVARRKQLEAITHPRIGAATVTALRDLAQAGTALAAVEAAIMIENGSYRMYDLLLVVACRPEVQEARLVARQGISVEEARRWISSQMPVSEKVARADVVIHNDGDRAALEHSTAAALAAARQQLGLL